MALTFHQEIVSSKIDFLTKRRDRLSEQRNYLQTLIDEANEVLQVAGSWLTNLDGTNNNTFTDVNKLIEDKLVFLSSTEFSVDWDKKKHELSTTGSLPAISTNQHLPAQHDQVSVAANELEMIMVQVKAMQESMSTLSTNTENLLEKQLATDKHVESLTDKYYKIEQEKIEVLEIELKKNYESQKISMKLQDKRIKNIETKLQAVTDEQSDITENFHQQQRKMTEQKKESVKQTQQLTMDLNDVLEKVKKLSDEICLREDKSLQNNHLEYLEHKVKFLEANSEDLLSKFEEQGSSLEEFTRNIEETVKNMLSDAGSEFEKLQKFEDKMAALEMSLSETSQETRESYQDMETKYNTMCQFVALRLGPLERLRDIFNEKLDVRKTNIKKLNSVCDQMTDLLATFSHEETLKKGQAIGFAARVNWTPYLGLNTPNNGTFDVISNSGNHFDPSTGVFTVPQDGLYATSIFNRQNEFGQMLLAIVKLPCDCPKTTIGCKTCTVCDVVTEKGDKNTSVFVVVELKAGNKLSMKWQSEYRVSIAPSNAMFNCVRIV